MLTYRGYYKEKGFYSLQVQQVVSGAARDVNCATQAFGDCGYTFRSILDSIKTGFAECKQSTGETVSTFVKIETDNQRFAKFYRQSTGILICEIEITNKLQK